MFSSRTRTAVAVPTALVIVLSLVALAGPMTGMLPASAATTAPRGTTPGRYVRTTCHTLGTWIDETWPLDQAVTTTADRLGRSKITPSQAKAQVVRSYAKATAASNDLVKAMEQVGAPLMPHGQELAADYLRTLTDLRSTYHDAMASASRLAVNSRSTLLDRLTKLDTSVTDQFASIGVPFEVLQTNTTLKQLLESETSCATLLDAFTASAAPADVAPGDCVNRYLEKLPCMAPHDDEIFVVTTYPAPAGAPFPGNTALTAFTDQQCIPAFASYVGVSFDASQYTYGSFSPTADTWSKGDRQVICGVENVDATKLVGSVKRSGTSGPTTGSSDSLTAHA
jgi:Septum formation